MDKQPAASAEQARPARGLAGHCARAAAVGGVLGLAVTVVASTIPGTDELGALGELAVAVVAWALSWPLLLVARVRRPWLTALLAPVALVALAQGMAMLASYVLVHGQWQQAATVAAVAVATAVPVVAAGGYAAAAFVGGPGVRPRWRVIVAVGVVALIPAQMVVGSMQQAARETDQAASSAAWDATQLAVFPHPLFAPDLPDYTIIKYHVDLSEPSFAFWLRPKSAPQHADASLTIAVFQTPAPARFTPPANCAVPDLGNGEAAPCATVAPDVWRVANPLNGWASHYLARRGDQVIQISPGAAAIPESDLARAATTLRQQPPRYFLG